MAEDTKNPAQDIILIGLVGAMTLTTALYCVLTITLCFSGGPRIISLGRHTV
jgi:APA family basic amino acid/polyamine antiporter